MESGKAPGIDGLPIEFYKCLGEDLLLVINHSLAKGRLPLSCRRAVLTLLPKKGDLSITLANRLIQNAAARLVFNLPKFSHTTPLLRSLHWLPVAARIRFKTLMLAYKAKHGPAPSYLKALITPRTAPRTLRSTSTARLVPPSLRVRGKYTTRLFSVLAPRWWNELPLEVRTAESLAIFKRRLKTYLFRKHFN
ncbi:uncharacterized protein LOC114772546 [Tachysurus ichikawai]